MIERLEHGWLKLNVERPKLALDRLQILSLSRPMDR